MALWLDPKKSLVAGQKANEKGGQLSDPLGFIDSAEIPLITVLTN